MIRKPSSVVWFVTLLVLLGPSASLRAGDDPVPSGHFSVSVDCQTFAERGAYSCTAVASDLPSGEEYLSGLLNGRLGDTVKSERSFEVGGATYRLEIDVTAAESSTRFEFRAFRDDQLVAKQAGSLSP